MRPAMVRTASVVLYTILALVGVPTAEALPAGKSWAPVEAVDVPRIVALSTPLLEPDSLGRLRLVCGVRWDSLPGRRDWACLPWRDSVWTGAFYAHALAGDVPKPSVVRTNEHFVDWLIPDTIGSGYGALGHVQLFTGAFGRVEVIGPTLEQDSEYGSTTIGTHRTYVRAEQNFPISTSLILRVFLSDTTDQWHALSSPPQSDNQPHLSLAPLDNGQILLVHSGQNGLRWSILDGNAWIDSGVLNSIPYSAHTPRLAVRENGGLWLAWSGGLDPYFHVAEYVSGRWDTVATLQCLHPVGETFAPVWCSISRDGVGRPAVAWGETGYGTTNRDVICFAFPLDSSWAQAEEVPGSSGLGDVDPTVAKDSSGDCWVAWSPIGVGGVYFTHTFTSSIPTAPILRNSRGTVLATWTIRPPCPGSMWSIERSIDGDKFETVGSIKAASDSVLQMDMGQSAGRAVYRVRRETEDLRYSLVSASTLFPPPGRMARRLVISNPTSSGGVLSFELSGLSTGLIATRVYDILGRLVGLTNSIPDSNGHASVQIAVGNRHIRQGIYFVRVEDASSNEAFGRFPLLN